MAIAWEEMGKSGGFARSMPKVRPALLRSNRTAGSMSTCSIWRLCRPPVALNVGHDVYRLLTGHWSGPTFAETRSRSRLSLLFAHAAVREQCIGALRFLPVAFSGVGPSCKCVSSQRPKPNTFGRADHMRQVLLTVSGKRVSSRAGHCRCGRAVASV